MSFHTVWELRGIVVTYAGVVAAKEVLECHRRIAADVRFEELRYAIVDTLGVQAVTLSHADPEEIEALLKGPFITNPRVKVVVVATHEDALRLLALYNTIVERSYPLTICPTIEAAREAIGK